MRNLLQALECSQLAAAGGSAADGQPEAPAPSVKQLSKSQLRKLRKMIEKLEKSQTKET